MERGKWLVMDALTPHISALMSLVKASLMAIPHFKESTEVHANCMFAKRKRIFVMSLVNIIGLFQLQMEKIKLKPA